MRIDIQDLLHVSRTEVMAEVGLRQVGVNLPRIAISSLHLAALPPPIRH